MALAFLIVLLAAVVGSAGMVGVFAWMLNRVRALEAGGGGEAGRLAADVERLEAELLSTQAEMERLTERLDFTEQLLGSGRPRDAGPESS